MMYSNRKAKVFYLAACAQDAEFHSFSCNSLVMVTRGEPERVTDYADMFRPDVTDNGTAWGVDWGDDKQACRVLALLFAAAMAEAGDL